MTTPAETAQATTAILESGAIMLGAALVFVTLFRRLEARRDPGLHRRRRADRAAGARPDRAIPQQLTSVTEIGIALLLFIVGLELQPSRLWRLRKDIFGLGLAQVVLCGVALSLFIYLALGISPEAALAIGLPLALSSTAQVLPMLRSDNELNTPQGERAFSILLFQDLSIVPMITIIAAMARVPPDPSAPSGLAAGALHRRSRSIGLVVAGRLVLNPLFRLIGRFGERELFVVAGLFTVVGSAAVMHALHLSVALGAFVAGVMLAESPYRHELESDVEPFRSILLGLFFLSVGMLLDLGRDRRQRPLSGHRPGRRGDRHQDDADRRARPAFGNSWPRSVRLGLLLSQAGEFGFVLFAQATAARLILPEAASLFGAVVTLSMATTPFLMRLTDWLERREERSADGLDGPEKSPETSAIVVGYGRFGQTVAQMLMAKRIGVTLDRQEAEHDRASARNSAPRSIMATALRLDLLRTAGAETAKVIAFCNDNEGGEMTRERGEGRARGFPAGRGHGPGLRPRASDGARRARPCLRAARAVRKRRRHGPRRAEGERDRRERGRAGRARISDARLRAARAAERDRRPACRRGDVRSRPTPAAGRGRRGTAS